MPVALLKFTQHLTVGADGQALFGDLLHAFQVANSNNADVASWEIQILERPYGSAVPTGVLAQANGSTPAGSFTPDIAGGVWRIQLKVWPLINRQGQVDTDIRWIGVLGANGLLAPPPMIWPEPLPDPRTGRPGAKPNEGNFAGSLNGWAGNGADGLLRHLIRLAAGTGGNVVGPGSSVAGHVATFNSTTGLLLADGGIALSALATDAELAAGDAATLASALTLPVVTVSAATLTLDATHKFCYLRFTNAAGCVVTLNNNVFAAGDWIILRATQAAAVSFAGTLAPTAPATKAATSAEAGATLALIFASPTAADLSGEMSDA